VGNVEGGNFAPACLEKGRKEGSLPVDGEKERKGGEHGYPPATSRLCLRDRLGKPRARLREGVRNTTGGPEERPLARYEARKDDRDADMS